jgi:thiosulfate/3-mercaptopyruvate sulfurtransferase
MYPNLVVLDAAWYMPVHKRDNHADYRAERIPGARFFDTDGIALDDAAAKGLPHMLPTEQVPSHATTEARDTASAVPHASMR